MDFAKAPRKDDASKFDLQYSSGPLYRVRFPP